MPSSFEIKVKGMLGHNFSGQFRRRRNINLGDRKKPAATRTSLLQKAQADREKRHQTKEEEKAASKTQAYVRHSLNLYKTRKDIKSSWDDMYLNENAFGSGDNIEGTQFVRFMADFNFFFGKLVNEMDINDTRRLVLVYNVLSQQNVPNINMFLSRSLLLDIHKNVLTLIQDKHLWVSLGEGNNTTFYDLLFGILLLIFSKDSTSYKSHEQVFKGLGNFLSDFITSKLPTSTLPPTLFTVLKFFSYRDTRSLSLYILSIPHLFDIFPKNDLSDLGSQVAHQLSIINSSDDTLINLTRDQKIWLLVNFIFLTDHSISIEIIVALGNIVSSLNVLFKSALVNDKDDSESEEEKSEIDSKISKSGVFILNDKFIHNQLNFLYTREFTMKVFDLANDNPQALKNVLALFYSSLIKIFPSKKNSLMLYLSVQLNSSSLKFFYQTAVQSPQFELFYKSDLKLPELTQILQTNGLHWASLVIFLEMYSFWLIISDDIEFFSADTTGLQIEEVLNLCTFLKNICFSIIWNDGKVNIPKIADTDISYSRLKAITIKVLKQIYIRDSRRAFVPTDFWLMSQKIALNNFVVAVAEEEERRHEAQEAQDDETDSDDDGDTPSFLSNIGSRNKAHRAPKTKLMQHELSARLSILENTPFFLPFFDRVRIFQAFLSLDQSRLISNRYSAFFDVGPSSRDGTIRRNNVFGDAYESFHDLGADFKHNIRVTFLNEYGPEAGIDGGGLTKEFLTSVCNDGFSPSTGLFVTTDDHLLYPNPILGVPDKYLTEEDKKIRRKKLQYIKFLGSIIGKCLYEGVLVPVDFASFFLQKWFSKNQIRNSFDDLYSLDPDLHSGLAKLRRYSDNVEDLALNFTIVQEVLYGDSTRQVTIDLQPNGSNIAVTNANRLEYVHAVANFKLNSVLHLQSQAFLQGMTSFISPLWLGMFNPNELQMLVSGGSSSINIDDLRKHTVYGGYLENEITVKYFWEVLAEMTPTELSKLIKFVTSVPRAPLLGFGELKPLFSLRNSGSDINRLPTASTCVNLLKLPDYKDKKILREKLLYSISAEAGFDLS